MFGERDFDYVVTVDTTYYRRTRPHASRDRLPPLREIPEEVESL